MLMNFALPSVGTASATQAEVTMKPNARTIYIDHSTASQEPWWPSLERAMASGNLKLALSLWNLFEIGAADDKGQQNRRLRFLQGFNPTWGVERRAGQKQEV